MKITKKFDRAFQWAGEKMGAESRTTHSDEFKMLETEMALRIEGAERMHKSMNAYVKWATRRDETFDREKATPGSHVARAMITHGEEFEADSDFGNSLIAVGRANERLASLQEQYIAEITSTWLESLNRNLAMMREYQAARKKLESRRLAFDTASVKAQKSKREDYRLEEDVRSSRAKFEEASDDVLRRMQDIKEAETDSLRGLAGFLDAQLDFHDRCTEELRRAREDLGGIGIAPLRAGSSHSSSPPPRPRKTYSYASERIPRDHIYEEYEPDPEPERPRLSSRSSMRRPPPEIPSSPRPAAPSRSASMASSIAPSFTSSYSHTSISEKQRPVSRSSPGLERRSSSMAQQQQQQMIINPSNLRSQLRPVSRINTDASSAAATPRDDVFADYEDASTDSAAGSSPRWRGDDRGGWGTSSSQDRCVSPATSVGSWDPSTGSTRAGSVSSYRKAPPPPPSRAKKPAPPIPPKRGLY